MSQYQMTVAQNVCGDIKPCAPGSVAPIEGALTCTPIGDITQGGFPRAGGMIQYQLWSENCEPNPDPSLNICFGNPLYLSMCAAQPAYGSEYDPTKWQTSFAYFATRTSQQGTSAQFRAYAIITVPSQTTLTVNLIIQYLDQVAGENVWTSWINVTNTMNLVGAYSKIQGLAYISSPQYIPVTPSGSGPNCQVKYVSMIAGIQPLLYGCGTSQGDQTCGMWNGDRFLTCFRGYAVDKTQAQFPTPYMFAFNSTTCGSPSTAFCQCDECQITASFPLFDCQFNSDPAFLSYVNTGFESVGQVQQIQLAYGAPLEVMVKSIDGALWFYWKDTTVSPNWNRSAGTQHETHPLAIWEVSDAKWTLYFYSMIYPNPSIVPDCNQPTLYEMKPPEEQPPDPTPEPTPVPMTRTERLSVRANGGCGCGKKK